MNYPYTEPDPATIEELINLMAITHPEPNDDTTRICQRFVNEFGEDVFRELVGIHARQSVPIHTVLAVFLVEHEALTEKVLLSPIAIAQLKEVTECMPSRKFEQDCIPVPKQYSRNKRFRK